MLVFIDESGIHKQTDHSSFVLVFIEVKDEALINESIEQIEKGLKIQPFHWADFSSRSDWKIRKKFIKAISILPFTLKYIIVKNPILPQAMLRYALNHLLIGVDIKKVVIDGRHSRTYEQQLKTLLRRYGVSVDKLRVANDRSMPALRLADALAGLIRSYHDKNPDAENLYQLIESANKITSHLEVGGQAHR
ncbi:MAG: DUF3800 domain-containing protein [Candidatus Komeilibacteria bacterium]|nr:DUF3800 domain-containing protein [Candidatus Komeilibacteria bacterium]